MSTDTTTKMKLNTTTLTTKASVLVSPRTLNLTSRSIPPPLPTELQISIRNTGLCGSDLHYHTHFSVAGFPVVEPLTLEHEASGVITAMGSSVPWFEVGDRVALEVGIPCTSCDKCKEGRYNICKGMKFRSSARTVPHFQGTLQEVLNHEAKWCHKLPVGVSLEEGALVEPLSVGLHAVRRSGVDSGKSKACLVIGAGTIGLMTAAVLRARGVQTVVMADLDEKRIWFAAENGFADRGILVERQMEGTIEEKLAQSKDIAKKAGRAYHWGSLEPIEEFDVVFECTGVESCVQTAIYVSMSSGERVVDADTIPGNSARRQSLARWYWTADSNASNVSCSATRSRLGRGVPLRFHLP